MLLSAITKRSRRRTGSHTASPNSSSCGFKRSYVGTCPARPRECWTWGGVTGVHARWLAEDGYGVRIIDITPRHVDIANAELSGLDVVAEVGDVRRLNATDNSFDVVSMFGPLYHLPEHDDRITALREAVRVVRPGGVVAVAAISRFAALFDGLARKFLFDPDFVEIVVQDLATRQHRNPQERPHWWTTAFFHHPHQLQEEIAEAGLITQEPVGIEGLTAYLPGLADNWENEADRDKILWAARAVESEPTVLGVSPYLLLVAAVPK